MPPVPRMSAPGCRRPVHSPRSVHTQPRDKVRPLGCGFALDRAPHTECRTECRTARLLPLRADPRTVHTSLSLSLSSRRALVTEVRDAIMLHYPTRQRLIEKFSASDRNHDGFVTEEELVHQLHLVDHSLDCDAVGAFFAYVDTHNVGSVSIEELFLKITTLSWDAATPRSSPRKASALLPGHHPSLRRGSVSLRKVMAEATLCETDSSAVVGRPSPVPLARPAANHTNANHPGSRSRGRTSLKDGSPRNGARGMGPDQVLSRGERKRMAVSAVQVQGRSATLSGGAAEVSSGALGPITERVPPRPSKPKPKPEQGGRKKTRGRSSGGGRRAKH